LATGQSRPPQRKRISTLIPLDQFKRLEELAGRRPVSVLVARIIARFLVGSDARTCQPADQNKEDDMSRCVRRKES